VSLASDSSDPAVIARVQRYADRALSLDARQGVINTITSIQNRAHLRKVHSGPAAAWAAQH